MEEDLVTNAWFFLATFKNSFLMSAELISPPYSLGRTFLSRISKSFSVPLWISQRSLSLVDRKDLKSSPKVTAESGQSHFLIVQQLNGLLTVARTIEDDDIFVPTWEGACA
jgi:hypothetical protein